MRISLISLACRAIGAAFTAAAAELSQGCPLPPTSNAPQPVSPSGVGAEILGDQTPADGQDEGKDGMPVSMAPTDQPGDLAAVIRNALAQPVMVPPSARRKRRQRRLARHRADGSVGPDWRCDELGDVLSQAGVMELLGLRRSHVLELEARGKLKRELSRGKVCYPYEDVMRLAELVQAHQAGNQSKADAS